MLERDWQAQVIPLLEWSGWYVYHVTNVKNRLRAVTSIGFPDLIALSRRSDLIVAELKVGHNVTTDEQIRWLERFRAGGAYAAVWRPTPAPPKERWLRVDVGIDAIREYLHDPMLNINS